MTIVSCHGSPLCPAAVMGERLDVPKTAASSMETGETGEGEDDGVATQVQRLHRLALDWTLPVPEISIDGSAIAEVDAAAQIAFDWAHATAAAIGTIAHRILARIASDGLVAWDSTRLDAERGRINTALAQEGVPPEERADAAQRVAAVVDRTLADARGRWLFDPTHAEAQSEWALAGFDRATLRHVTLDRSMIADGVRWIVDFKTGRHEGGEAGAFLDHEVERYRGQLEGYARIVRELDSRRMRLPIRLALYFPLVEGGWREWAYSA